jgi:hypothetical protein
MHRILGVVGWNVASMNFVEAVKLKQANSLKKIVINRGLTSVLYS